MVFGIKQNNQNNVDCLTILIKGSDFKKMNTPSWKSIFLAENVILFSTLKQLNDEAHSISVRGNLISKTIFLFEILNYFLFIINQIKSRLRNATLIFSKCTKVLKLMTIIISRLIIATVIRELIKQNQTLKKIMYEKKYFS